MSQLKTGISNIGMCYPCFILSLNETKGKVKGLTLEMLQGVLTQVQPTNENGFVGFAYEKEGRYKYMGAVNPLQLPLLFKALEPYEHCYILDDRGERLDYQLYASAFYRTY